MLPCHRVTLGDRYGSRFHPRALKYACYILRDKGRVKSNLARRQKLLFRYWLIYCLKLKYTISICIPFFICTTCKLCHLLAILCIGCVQQQEFSRGGLSFEEGRFVSKQEVLIIIKHPSSCYNYAYCHILFKGTNLHCADHLVTLLSVCIGKQLWQALTNFAASSVMISPSLCYATTTVLLSRKKI